MSKYKVWLITDKGEGYTQQLPDWDDETGNLVLRLSAFGRDAVIEIEPTKEEKNND